MLHIKHRNVAQYYVNIKYNLVHSDLFFVQSCGSVYNHPVQWYSVWTGSL